MGPHLLMLLMDDDPPRWQLMACSCAPVHALAAIAAASEVMEIPVVFHERPHPTILDGKGHVMVMSTPDGTGMESNPKEPMN